MKKIVIPLLVAVFVTGAIVFIRENPNGSTRTNDLSVSENENMKSPGLNEVIIKDFSFSPKTLKVKKGTTVTWTNRDSAGHDIMPDSPSDAFKPSQLLSNGESYSFTFEKPGVYEYYCSPHPYMKGTIEVTE